MVVDAVKPSSAAAEGKFLKGDSILKVEGVAVASPIAFDRRAAAFESRQRLKIQFEREGKVQDGWVLIPFKNPPGPITTPTPLPNPAAADWPRPVKEILDPPVQFDKQKGTVSLDGRPFTGRGTVKHQDGRVMVEFEADQGVMARSIKFFPNGQKQSESVMIKGHVTKRHWTPAGEELPVERGPVPLPVPVP